MRVFSSRIRFSRRGVVGICTLVFLVLTGCDSEDSSADLDTNVGIANDVEVTADAGSAEDVEITSDVALVGDIEVDDIATGPDTAPGDDVGPDAEPEFENACGGTEELDGEPGGECGACGVWECDGDNALSCMGSVDLQSDDSNCGQCSNACDEGQSCVDGECNETAPGEFVECNEELVDLQTSTSHCGKCNRRCGPGVFCEAGECQVDCHAEELSLVENPVIDKDSTAIHAITVDGVNLVEDNGGYYVIGTCTGADDEHHNVISRGSDGSTLHAPGDCPGAPFSISYSGTNPLEISITVGPLPVDYRGLSVPFDPHRDYFADFSFSGSEYYVGCGDNWSEVSGAGAAFSSIPQPCTIPGHGDVGLARFTEVMDGTRGEIRGPHANIRRVVSSSNLSELYFVRHPYTHNVEFSWGTEPLSTSHLPAGSVYHLEEELYIVEPDSSDGSSSSLLISYELPPSGTSGSTVPAVVTMCNNGSTTWSEPGDNTGGIRLGSLSSNTIVWSPGASGGYSNDVEEQRIYVGEPVEPGSIVDFEFDLLLPGSPGDYLFGAQMVHDGVAWFGPEISAEVHVAP